MAILEYSLYIIITIALAWPLGRYISRVMDGKKVCTAWAIGPLERGLYHILRISPDSQMTWKQYLLSVLALSGVSLVVLWGILMLQGILPGNPQHIPGMGWALAFNTAVSFVTNTNWQAYAGEASLSYFSQSIGLVVQNFISPAVGLSVLFALIRALVQTGKQSLGSLWVDLTRSILYILIPLSLILAILLVSQGVMQNIKPYETVELLQPYEAADGTVITQQVVPMGPQASQVAIKQLGTNGGGFNGTNSASPLENPSIFSNLLQMVSILLIPMACCFAFGRSIRDMRQGWAIFLAMLILLLIALCIVGATEQHGTLGIPNMEGKEVRLGIPASSTWAVYTTAASNGSVNAMLDSFTPIGGMVPMLLIQLGEVVFGGVGCGLYGMIGFVLLTVFIAGLMVGRTPEYLGKKIEPAQMRMAVLVCLATPISILVGSAIAAMMPATTASLGNQGPHGMSELIYAYSSAGGNNGSAFAGFNANTTFINISLALVMLFARFVPIYATLSIAGSMATKQRHSVSAGTLSTSNGMFVFLLILIVLIIGALSFVPALSLGPIANALQMTRL